MLAWWLKDGLIRVVQSSRTRCCQQEAKALDLLRMEGSGVVPKDSGSAFISSSQHLLASIQKSLYSMEILKQCSLWKPGMPSMEKLRCRVEMGVLCYQITGLRAARPGLAHRPPKERGTEPWKGRPSRLLTGGKKVLVIQI